MLCCEVLYEYEPQLQLHSCFIAIHTHIQCVRFTTFTYEYERDHPGYLSAVSLQLSLKCNHLATKP